jgi:hypothetical protein
MINEDELKVLCDTVWEYLLRVFDRDDVSGADMASIVLTINTRFLNAMKNDNAPIAIEQLKNTFIDLINEKLGKND